MIIKTKIIGINITANPVFPIRTTKGGKRILTKDPYLSVNCILEVEDNNSVRLGDVMTVLQFNNHFRAYRKDNKLFLQNVQLEWHGNLLNLSTDQEIEMYCRWQTFIEGSSIHG